MLKEAALEGAEAKSEPKTTLKRPKTTRKCLENGSKRESKSVFIRNQVPEVPSSTCQEEASVSKSRSRLLKHAWRR